MSELGIGLIGCGRMGRALAQVIRDQVPGAAMVAGYDPFPGSREAFAREIGAPAVDSLEELLGRDDVGAVLIASPNHLHREQTEAAAAAGKHVFCEKPMALSVADCDRMIAACEQAGVRLMVGHNTRLEPLSRRLREIAESGELGAPLYGYGCYFFDGFKERESGVWHLDRAHSGGVLFHMGIHQIDLFHAIFGPTRRVQYAGGRYGSQVHDFDDIASILLDFAPAEGEPGATAVLSVAAIASSPMRRLYFLFSRGYAAMDSPWGHLEYAAEGGEPVRVEAESLPYPASTQLELTNFVAWILRDETPLLTGAEGRAAVAVAEAADLAREKGTAIAVSQ